MNKVVEKIGFCGILRDAKGWGRVGLAVVAVALGAWQALAEGPTDTLTAVVDPDSTYRPTQITNGGFDTAPWVDYYYQGRVDQTEPEKPVEFSYAALYSINAASETAMVGDRVAMALEPGRISTGAINTPMDATYATGVYSFQFRLFNDIDELVGLSTLTYGWEDLLDHVYTTMGQTGATPMVVTSFAVPEPTGSVLLLFGLAVLALKRKV